MIISLPGDNTLLIIKIKIARDLQGSLGHFIGVTALSQQILSCSVSADHFTCHLLGLSRSIRVVPSLTYHTHTHNESPCIGSRHRCHSLLLPLPPTCWSVLQQRRSSAVSNFQLSPVDGLLVLLSCLVNTYRPCLCGLLVVVLHTHVAAIVNAISWSLLQTVIEITCHLSLMLQRDDRLSIHFIRATHSKETLVHLLPSPPSPQSLARLLLYSESSRKSTVKHTVKASFPFLLSTKNKYTHWRILIIDFSIVGFILDWFLTGHVQNTDHLSVVKRYVILVDGSCTLTDSCR
jgi:hypothetical protein